MATMSAPFAAGLITRANLAKTTKWEADSLDRIGEARFSYRALPQIDPRRFSEYGNHQRAEPNNLQDRSCRMGIFPLTSVSHPVCRYRIRGPCADFGIDGIDEHPPDDMSHHNGSGA